MPKSTTIIKEVVEDSKITLLDNFSEWLHHNELVNFGGTNDQDIKCCFENGGEGLIKMVCPVMD
ncbi:hypothetical protein AAKU52_003532 [Pedobacter sp. CG_S7]|uniref:hypothetical protein n=1 Tax=Pedobacter sp. CG_S7 TaxID=3143930 RepID=UPI003392B8FA